MKRNYGLNFTDFPCEISFFLPNPTWERHHEASCFFDWQFKDYNPATLTSQLGKTNVLLQDNTSAIQLERYGKQSSTKCARHRSIRYFYVTDKLQDKTLTVISYCPTREMTSDYLRKSLQVSIFRTHWNAIMAITEQDEAKSFNAYKIRLEQRKLKDQKCSLFLFIYLLFFQGFFINSTSLMLGAICLRSVLEHIIFHF